MELTLNRQQTPNNYITLGVIISILVHIILIVSLSHAPLAPNTSQDETPIMVGINFEPQRNKTEPPAVPQRQIVSETKQQLDTNIDNRPRFLSDKDASTEKEQIKRGDAPDAAPQISPNTQQAPAPAPMQKVDAQQQQPQQSQNAPQKQAQQPNPQHKSETNTEKANSAPNHLKVLALDPDTLKAKLEANQQKEAQKQAKADNTNALNNSPVAPIGATQPFSRPSGSGARFLGRSGSSDYLPNLPDGDITLLNTKADMYAVFVRRVATQVFGELRSSGWERLRAQDIMAIRDDCTVLAVLSPKGQLLKTTIDSSSGNARFDQVLYNSVQQAARDPNPPLSAATGDGNIHFIFKAKSWVQYAGDPRSAAPVERRWLLLATGLE